LERALAITSEPAADAISSSESVSSEECSTTEPLSPPAKPEASAGLPDARLPLLHKLAAESLCAAAPFSSPSFRTADGKGTECITPLVAPVPEAKALPDDSVLLLANSGILAGAGGRPREAAPAGVRCVIMNEELTVCASLPSPSPSASPVPILRCVCEASEPLSEAQLDSRLRAVPLASSTRPREDDDGTDTEVPRTGAEAGRLAGGLL
jgi:hypothetical protein